MDEKNRVNGPQSAQGSGAAAPRKRKRRKKRSIIGRIFFWLFTLCLVGVLTAAIFVGIFLRYVNTSLRGHVEVDVEAYNPSVSSELYYRDPETEEWVMYDTLFLNAENRIWATLDEIPKSLRDAAIAVEDRRFETHQGVDWKGILRAVKSTLTGGDVQGGSSITQQMIKNVTGDNQNTVKRKVVEIYRALAFEETHSKDEILEIYLNYIYMGESCYGVKTAAKMYFGCELEELDLAQCASLISITNNPSMYDPLISDWTRKNNRERQVWVLNKMLELEKITEAQYNAARNEEIVFTNGYTNKGNFVRELPQESEEGEEPPEETVQRARNSYFTDQVIEDVMSAFMDKYGYDRKTAENKVFSGCKIYTTQNINIQRICEDVFENTALAENTDKHGKPLQAAITLMDPYNGEVLAMVGGTGVKTVDRGWNWATAPRQCGSAIKPISSYGPAIDDGTITPASVIDDYPISMNGRPYPNNASRTIGGLTTVYRALTSSLNTCAARVNMAYGTTRSYNFMVEKLGFTTLDPDTDSVHVGAMSLGGLEYGVTTEEMCAAYCAFVNDGLYTRPYTFTRVEDADGNVLLENTPQVTVAFKETTAYLMRNLLRAVVTNGTGGGAYFDGMIAAGKTGTTDDDHDRYFAGFTPYYCAAVWTGYESNTPIRVGFNPSSRLWKEVMQRVHEGLDDPGFHPCNSGLTTVTVCMDSGLLATENCKHDLRGSRLQTVTVSAEYAPTKTCNMHKMIRYCTEGEHLATEYCPEECVEEVAVLDYDRETINDLKAPDDEYLLRVVSGQVDYVPELCPVHDTPPEPEPEPDPVFPDPWDVIPVPDPVIPPEDPDTGG